MVFRLLIPMLLTGALALACGPRSHSEASASDTAPGRMSEDTGRARAERARRARRDGEILPALTVRAAAGEIRFALAIENAGSKTVELHFPDGQVYDFVVLDSVGRVVWRWAEGRMFTQAHKTHAIAGGETYRIEEAWDAKVPAGRYTAVATVRSTNYPIEERFAFTR